MMCCRRHAGHQQLAPGADGTGSEAGNKVHQHGGGGTAGSASVIAQENCVPQREQVLMASAYRTRQENTTGWPYNAYRFTATGCKIAPKIFLPDSP
jgi:hypothetical protein